LYDAPYLLLKRQSELIARQIALGVIMAWGHTVYTQFELLAGKSAPHDFIQLIVYKAMIFSEDIEKIDTVRAYHVSVVILQKKNSR